MTRSPLPLLALTLALAALPALGAASDDPTQPRTKPNILLILTDQQHAGMLGSAGNPNLETPALDGLAKSGVRFTKAYVTNPVCAPSRISMATGRMPGSFGMFHNAAKATIPASVRVQSLGRQIKAAGYETFYGGKADMSGALAPQNSGFDEYFPSPREPLVAACIEFIEKERSAPFFAVASFINPHDICYADRTRQDPTLTAPQPIRELYRQAAALPLDELPPLPANFAIPEGEPDAVDASLHTDAVTPSRTMRATYGEREWRMYRWIYCRLTERVDGHIGQLLAALEQSHLDESTLVVFTSDHGDMDASHRLPSKAHFYEESAGVPFVIRFEGTIPGGRVDDTSLVSTGLDLLPTLCDFAGVAAPAELLGRSLRPALIEGRDRPRRPYVVSENHTGRMLRSADFKYIVFIEGEPRESLFDLRTDRTELVNLASSPEYRAELDRHRGLLQDWIRESGDTTAAEFALAPSED